MKEANIDDTKCKMCILNEISKCSKLRQRNLHVKLTIVVKKMS